MSRDDTAVSAHSEALRTSILLWDRQNVGGTFPEAPVFVTAADPPVPCGFRASFARRLCSSRTWQASGVDVAG